MFIGSVARFAKPEKKKEKSIATVSLAYESIK